MPKKRSLIIQGHHTSITLEKAFWDALRDIAKKKKSTVTKIIETIDIQRTQGTAPQNLSSAIRLFILRYYQENGSHNTTLGQKSNQKDD